MDTVEANSIIRARHSKGSSDELVIKILVTYSLQNLFYYVCMLTYEEAGHVSGAFHRIVSMNLQRKCTYCIGLNLTMLENITNRYTVK